MKLIDYQIRSPTHRIIKTALLPIYYLNTARCGWLHKANKESKNLILNSLIGHKFSLSCLPFNT